MTTHQQHIFHRLFTRLVIFISLVQFSYVQLQAQNDTLYAIICAATLVNDIGSGCEASALQIEQTIGFAGALCGMPVKYYFCKGSDFQKDFILRTLDSINPRTNDAIFFFATSHGFNMADSTTRYPYLVAHPTRESTLAACEVEEFGLSLEKEVYATLEKKNARLTVVLGEACNTVIEWRLPEQYNAMNLNCAARMKDLFANSRGKVIGASSKPGQASWTDPSNGGVYTQSFINAMNDLLASPKPVSWDDQMEKTRQYSISHAQKAKLPGGQESIHDVQIQSAVFFIDEYDQPVEYIEPIKYFPAQLNPDKKQK